MAVMSFPAVLIPGWDFSGICILNDGGSERSGGSERNGRSERNDISEEKSI